MGSDQPIRAAGPAARDAVTGFVALGANLGDAPAALVSAVRSLRALPATRLTACSSLYRTAPVASDGAAAPSSTLGPDYFNAVVRLETGLTAPALLDHLQQIELRAGRERPYRDAPRTLDLDLVLYGHARIESLRLTVPHPRMRSRAFVLVPLAEIAPEEVTAADLSAVGDQVIQRLDGVAQWPANPPLA
ncbi:MAG: 2-amino-4-hydroxy-6-hydroxymethyldihydropteridine diphosphokinase [Polaromonas sp.]|nr:2-amino-4-hydroxy-6-hydroxymethyldihydropteridine diphosphokinase [Polaromonas sp.]